MSADILGDLGDLEALGHGLAEEALEHAFPTPDFTDPAVQMGARPILIDRIARTSLRYCGVAENFDLISAVPGESFDFENSDIAETLELGLVFDAHLLGQTLGSDSPHGADVEPIHIIRPIFDSIADLYWGPNRGSSRLWITNPKDELVQAAIWHQLVMKRQRTMYGEEVASPYGPEYAAKGAHGEVVLPDVSPLPLAYALRADRLVDTTHPKLLALHNGVAGYKP